MLSHPSFLRRSAHLTAAVVGTLLAAGCGGDRKVSMAVGLSKTSRAALTQNQPSAAGLQLSDGTNDLIIDSAELVLREIEFERQEFSGSSCPDGESGDDSCEKFEAGPLVVSLPLDGSLELPIETAVAAGTYDEIELDIHKLEGEEDRAVLAARPELTGVSIRVTGTFAGTAFVFTTDLDEEQEHELATPMVVSEDGASVSVTMAVDVATWFVDGNGDLYDPASANDGQPNEGLAEQSIRASLELFEDHDHDGVRHSEDDDESDD